MCGPSGLGSAGERGDTTSCDDPGVADLAPVKRTRKRTLSELLCNSAPSREVFIVAAPSATEARAARERLLLNLNLAAYYRRQAAGEECGVVRDALVQDAINKLTCARAIRRVYGV